MIEHINCASRAAIEWPAQQRSFAGRKKKGKRKGGGKEEENNTSKDGWLTWWAARLIQE